MAKPKAQTSVHNRHIYSRASYLYQAANYLAQVRHSEQGEVPLHEGTASSKDEQTSSDLQRRRNLSRQMLSDMKSISLKTQIRNSPNIKGTICKFCDSLLIEGQTSQSAIENASKGGRKPWADVLTIHCKTCGNVKRYPVLSRKQQRKHLRQAQATDESVPQTAEPSAPT